MERRWRRIAAAALFTSVALGGRTTGRWRSRGLVQRLAGAALLLPRPGAAQEGIHLEGLDANGDGFVDRVELMYVARDILDDQGAVEKRGREAVYEGFAALYEASDIDGDGVLSDAEVLFASRLSQSSKDTEYGRAPAQKLHTQLDENGDGIVDLAEFDEFVRAVLPPRKAEAVAGATFAKADVDGDAGLSWLECQFAVMMMVENRWKSMVAAIFDDMDKNADGRISRREVLAAQRRRNDDPSGPSSGLLPQILDGFVAADWDMDGYLDHREVAGLVDRLLT